VLSESGIISAAHFRATLWRAKDDVFWRTLQKNSGRQRSEAAYMGTLEGNARAEFVEKKAKRGWRQKKPCRASVVGGRGGSASIGAFSSVAPGGGFAGGGTFRACCSPKTAFVCGADRPENRRAMGPSWCETAI